MIMDAFLLFSGNPAGVTSGVGNSDKVSDSPTTGAQPSFNILDLHIVGLPVLANLQGARDMGIGDDPALKILSQVIAAFTGGTSMSVTLQGATDNGAGAPNAFVSWWASPVYTEAQLVLGARLMDMDMPRPPAGVAIPRFLQLLYTSVGTHGAGKLESTIVLDRMDQFYSSTNNAVMGGYAPGITIPN